MSQFVDLPLLKEPPLVEVLYSMQAVSAPGISRGHVRPLVDEALSDSFTIEEIRELKVLVQSSGGKHVQEQEDEWVGCKAISTNGKQIVHLMRQGLFINFLPPYQGFPECIGEVQRCWDLYQRCFTPEQVSRIGIRYINQLSVPLDDGAVRFDEHFKLQTFYPVDGPFLLHRFHNQFEISEPEHGLPARVIFTSTKESREALEVVLDIEAYEEVSRPPKDPLIWDRFEQARQWAYKIFSNTLTPQCFQRYQ